MVRPSCASPSGSSKCWRTEPPCHPPMRNRMGTVHLERETKSRLRAAVHAAVGVVTALAMSPCCGSARAQSKLTAHYALSLAGFTIGEGEWGVDIGKDRYAAAS